MADEAKNKQDSKQPQFAIERIFNSGGSFESPQAPEIFKENPQFGVNIDINTSHKKLEEGLYCVTLKVTAEAKIKDKDVVAYISEAEQSGIFTINNFPEEQLDRVINSLCPNILFPYASQRIATMVSDGSFPPLHLAPINFEALYAQRLEQEKQKEKGEAN